MSIVEEATAPRVAPQPPVVSDEVRDVLREAKGLLAKGWCQGRYYEDGRYCVSGALGQAAGMGVTGRTLLYARHAFELYEAARRLVEAPLESGGIAFWNDQIGRTQAEAVDLLDRALGA